MTEVPIARLKARLSEQLRRVRAGETITVLDRREPIARIVPYEPGIRLRVRLPPPGSPRPGDLPPGRPRRVKTDIVAMLLAERRRR